MSQFDEFGREEHEDDFESRMGREIREAYEAMGPTPEAEARMLAQLRVAAKARAGRVEDSEAAAYHLAVRTSAVAPARRKRVPRWAKVALPAAACLALVAGAGLLLAQQKLSSETVGGSELAVLVSASSDGSSKSAASEAVPVSGLAGSADGAADTSECAEYNHFYGEGYEDAGEPGFILAAEQPLSTFSADVDTASYANLRRLIQEGAGFGTIDPGAVRIEEMLNYFDYDYAAPGSDDVFALTANAGACPWNPESELVVLGLSTGDTATSAEEAPPTNLVLLVDVSGSMESPDKLPLLKESVARIVEGLTERDRVSVVTYSGAEEVVLSGVPGSDAAAIMGAVNGLKAAGATNGQAGLEMAYRVAEENHIPGGVNRIVMASDGDLNVGISSLEELESFISDKRNQGIYLSVLGFGTGNYQDAKMELLADKGNGSYHYIDSVDEAERVYERSLAVGATPVADDVKLQVEFDPALVESYRLIGYANRALADEDFRNDSVDAGEVCAGAEVTAAYEVVLTDEGRRAGADEPWLTCTVRYKPAGEHAGEAPKELRFNVGSGNWAEDPGADWSLAAGVIEFGMLARVSEYAGSSTPDAAVALVEASIGGLDSTDRTARRELVDLILAAEITPLYG